MDRAITPEQRAAAQERDWDDEIFSRIQELQVPPAMIARWLQWNTAPSDIKRGIDRYEKATFGALRQREATIDDNEKLTELYAATPERIGDWDVTAERAPYAFAQFRLQENVQIQVLEEAGVIRAVITRSWRDVLVGGVPLSICFTAAGRVHPDSRGRGYMRYVRSAAIGCAPYTNADYWYFRAQNAAIFDYMRRNEPGRLEAAAQQEGSIPGIPVTVHSYPAKAFMGADERIRPTRPEDTPLCIDLINQTHNGQDLFRPYTTDFFERRMNDGGWGPKPDWWIPVYGREDHWVLEEDGQPIACAGLWDRGRHLRDRWRHHESGQIKVVERTALLDFGFAPGREDALVRLIEFLLGRTHDLGRAALMAPLQQLPKVAEQLVHYEPTSDIYAMQWEYHPPHGSGLPATLPITKPYTDLVYW